MAQLYLFKGGILSLDITVARQMYKTQGLFNMPLRVCHYDRVSSDTEEQLNSLANQNIFNEETIKNNPFWTYAGKYVDEGISGISTVKREDFQRLIEDAKRGLFDLVITKEISRFARNILDSIKFTRELLSYGVFVWFQNDNINTIEEDSEFRLAIMASVAQEESRKLSSRVRYGHSVSIKNGVILGHDIYGYKKKDKKTYSYDLYYKPMVEYIFEQYATGSTSTKKLAEEIYEMGYRSFKGGKIDPAVIKHIITNPKYKGYYCGGKVKIVDMFTKKQKFLSEEEWIMHKDIEAIPPMVTEALWERANEVYRQRSNQVKDRKSSFGNIENKFTRKIVCANDGEYYWLKGNLSRNKNIPGNNPRWQCSKKKKRSADCSSFTIYESELIPIILELIKNTVFTDDLIEEYVKLYKSVSETSNYEKQIETIQNEINRINQKKDTILEYSLEGMISKTEYIKRNNEFNQQIDEKQKQIDEYRRLTGNSDNFSDVLKKIKKVFSEMENIEFTEINATMIDKLFDKIIAKPISDTEMELTFVLNDGTTSYSNYNSKQVQSVGGHSGNTLKKMIEAQERQMAGK